MSNSVVKPWMDKLTWKEQSAIFTAIRGSDVHDNRVIRNLIRWIRRQAFYDADINGSFVKVDNSILSVPGNLKPALEYETVHFASHLFHAVQIIGIKHPNEQIREIALGYYYLFCDMLHLGPEPHISYNRRLKDNREKINVNDDKYYSARHPEQKSIIRDNSSVYKCRLHENCDEYEEQAGFK